MATFEIPVRNDGYPSHDIDVELEGSIYNLFFWWNERESAWYFSLADSDGVDIVSSQKIVADWDLLRLVTDERRPPGSLFAVDTAEGGDPGQYELGSRVLITYVESSS
jgi:hypothetical protein